MVMALDDESLRKEFVRYHLARQTPQHQVAYRKKEPLVSVIIPTYNRADLLRDRCLRSVLDQSYRKLQVLVIGDACGDHTAEAVASLRDPRVSFVNLEGRPDYLSRGGWHCLAVRPMNHGLTLATGDFITGLDDDDAWVPGRVRTLVELAQRERLDFIFHGYVIEDRPGHFIQMASPDGRLCCGAVNNSTVFYHRFFRDLPWDPDCWAQWKEPADWNRFRKLGAFQPPMAYVREPLLIHYQEGTAGYGGGGPGADNELPLLHVHCGDRPLKGWVNLDSNPTFKPDLVCDADQGLPVEDGQAGALLCRDYARRHDAQSGEAFLRECARALRPGGLLRLGASPGDRDLAPELFRAGFRSIAPAEDAALGFQGLCARK